MKLFVYHRGYSIILTMVCLLGLSGAPSQPAQARQQRVLKDVPAGKATSPALAVTLSAAPDAGVLDNFNRVDGNLGENWAGDTASFAIASNQLDVISEGEIYWVGSQFGADHEISIRLANVTPDTQEILLLLKAQSTSTYTAGVIEVWLDPSKQLISIFTYVGYWVQHGPYLPMTIANGDHWRVLAKADGLVEVFRNGNLVASESTASWPYTQGGGYLGLWVIHANDALLDDFGGGNIGSQPPILSHKVYLPYTVEGGAELDFRFWQCNTSH